MRWNRSLQPCALLGALAALSGTGCYIIAAPPAPPPQPIIGMDSPLAAVPATSDAYTPPAAPARPAYGPPPLAIASRQQTVGVGASAGFFSTLDSEAVNGLSDGVMWNLHASIRLSEIMALQFDYGAANLDDQYSPLGGDMTIAPATASVVFSVPDPWMRNDMFRYRFGVGVGVAKLDHSAYEVDDISVFRMLFGVEWLLREGGRLFAVADIMVGEEVDDVSSSWWWDLSAMSSLRVGLEFGF